MSLGLDALAAAMAARGKQVDQLAHDVANVDTSGHRARQRAFSLDGAGPRLEARVDQRPGGIHATGEELDVAIVGAGYLVVEGPEGRPLATRQGRLSVDVEGNLSLDGARVLGDGGPIPRGEGRLTIGKDGSVRAGTEQLGRLRLVELENPEPADENGRFLVPDDALPASGQVRQHALEGSNLDLAATGSELLAGRAHFAAATRAFKTVMDDVVGGALRDLGEFR